jgi:hypothetical protein
MLTAMYYILRDGVAYRELGGHYFDRLDRTKVPNRLVNAYASLVTAFNCRRLRR